MSKIIDIEWHRGECGAAGYLVSYETSDEAYICFGGCSEDYDCDWRRCPLGSAVTINVCTEETLPSHVVDLLDEQGWL